MDKDIVIEGSKNRPVRIKVYNPKKTEAVMIIVHGMQEHSGRYEAIAKSFNENNIAVWTSDLRGHGANILSRPGEDDGDIFLNIVEDQKAIVCKAKKDYPDVPVVVLGHSYGSFVTQRLIKDRVPADKFILSGSTYMKGILYSLGLAVAKISRVFKGLDADAKMIENMGVRGYGKKFDGGNWLSRDNAVWEKYNQDKNCGQIFPVSFYLSMFSCIPKNYDKLKNSVGYAPKILVLSGDNDPVSGNGKGVKKLVGCYADAGFDVKMKLYAGGRHEMLNEINKDEVVEDIADFIKNY